MAFASIHVPNFMVQAVVSAEPELRGRVVTLVDGVAPLCVVVALNEAARAAGIQLGMSESQDEEFCNCSGYCRATFVVWLRRKHC